MTRREAGRKKRRRIGELISRLLTKVVDKDPWIMDINDDATLTIRLFRGPHRTRSHY
jgi:hypothetical protein